MLWNFWLINVGSFISVFIFSLLSTSAIIYLVACIYAAKQITFKKMMSVMPTVWKRFMVPFLWSFALFIVVAVGLQIGVVAIMRQFSVGPALRIAVAVILLILYVVGFVHITMICQLASVISVLEDLYGRKAMVKSKELIKGTMGLWVWCLLGVLVDSVLVQALFGSLVFLDVVPIEVT
ncbi:uncharacterized protein LOC120288344 [Eucalyptus grandis]|uniref:uncharacterized protein LOC120288344 n=1 Tax=Eucalyptus grandis TaxID=71139 RepID=UPI00192E7F68|nr:uncharacterized protein LOC120288344 [Eucalyptus grandis]